MDKLPDSVTVFPPHEQARVREAALRYALLMEVPEVMQDLVESWIVERVGDRAETWGPPSKGANAIASICRAMSTPGHYGRAPVITGADAEEAKRLMSRAWSKKQHVQYLSFGMGCCAVGIDVSEDLGRLIFEIVPSHHWWVKPHPDDVTEMAAFYHLRTRTLEMEGEVVQRYAWDIWDVSDVDNPVFRIALAEGGGVVGQDITQAVTGDGPREGADYPVVYADGRPGVPYSVHRARDTDEFYNWMLGKGAFEGALDDMLLSAYEMKSARDATGKSHIVSNVRVPGSKRVQQPDGSYLSVTRFEAGDVVFGEHAPGTQPWAYSFGSGEMLAELSKFRAARRNALSTDMGITPSDAARSGANPMSGLAIQLTNDTKRQEQHRQEPLCRDADLDLMRKSFVIAHGAGLTTVREPDVGITYHEIRRTPEEERERREGLAWDLEHGVMSPIDVYIARNPGATRDQARRELVRIAQERAEIEAAAATDDATPEPPA